MKKIIFFIIIIGVLVLTMTTCKKDPITTIPTEENTPFVVQSHIEIKELEDWLPKAYFNGEPKVVYVNESGQEKKLTVYMVRGEQERTYSNQNYTSDIFTIRLRDDNDISFTLDIEGYAVYGEKNDLQKSLFVFLMPGNENGSMSLPVQFDENGPKITMFDIFNEEISFFGHTYNDVFKGGAYTDELLFDSFSEVALNSEVGIVYFRDRVNDLWVFDRFE